MWMMVVLGIVLVAWVWSKRHISKQARPEVDAEEATLLSIGVLQSLPVILSEGYEGVTRERAEEVEVLREETLESLMGPKRTGDVDLVVSRHQSFHEERVSGYDRWAKIQDELAVLIKEGEGFFTQWTFYPHEWIFDINRLEQKKEDARSYQLSDPIQSSEETETFMKDFHHRISTFGSVHRLVTKSFEEWKSKEDTLTEDEKRNHMESKQNLCSLLQQGMLEDVELLRTEIDATLCPEGS